MISVSLESKNIKGVRWVNFNPGLNKNYSSNCIIEKKIMVLIKYCSDFPRKKLVNPKLTAQNLLC